MDTKKHITTLIDAWPRRKDFADAIGANVDAVHKWAAANRIPSDWQAIVVDAAQQSGMSHVTGDWMVRAHSRDGFKIMQIKSPKQSTPDNAEAS